MDLHKTIIRKKRLSFSRVDENDNFQNFQELLLFKIPEKSPIPHISEDLLIISYFLHRAEHM